jgi:peptidoglycan hydrolase-like protein with peptidoglycan-binding domain/DNA-binding XRE family transcriptional regulator
MRENGQDGYSPESELHNIQQKNSAKSAARANQLLRLARKKRSWSQKTLSEQIGVTKETISRWENGVSCPQPYWLEQLCEVFQTTPEALGYPFDPLEEVAPSPSEDPSPPQTADSATANSPASSTPKRRVLSRRRVIVAGGSALGGLILLIWFSLNKRQPPSSPRHWPTVAFDMQHTRASVRVVQWMLKAQNYSLDPTDVDGIFGAWTDHAVQKFQKDRQLPADGIVNNPTWELLIVPSDRGSSRSSVFALQERLQALDLLPTSDVNGEFSPQTAEALRRFQQSKHLPVQDVADLDTWCLLVGGKLSG